MKNSIQITFSEDLLSEFIKAIKEAVKEELPKYQDAHKREWLSTEQVMEMLDVSRRTLQNYRNEEKLSYFQHGRKILYPRESIESFLDKHMNEATTQSYNYHNDA